MRRCLVLFLTIFIAAGPAGANTRLHEYALLLGSESACDLSINSRKALTWLRDGDIDVNSDAVVIELSQLVSDVDRRVKSMDAATLEWHCATMRESIEMFDLSS